MPIKRPLQAPRFKSFHDIAALRGDGLRAELVALFERLAQGADATPSEIIETPKRCEREPGSASQNVARREALKKSSNCGNS
jgi:hypothetical protein